MLIDFTIDHLMKMRASQLVGIDLSIYTHVDGPAKTLVLGSDIVGCGGIHKLWNGVGEAWLILGDEALKHPIMVAFCSARIFRDIVNGFHRIQAHVLEGFDRGIKFAEMMGFEHEGLMKQFGPNRENYHRYVILR